MKQDTTKKLQKIYEKNVMNTYGTPAVLFVRGGGVNLYDANRRKYLDFSSGISVCNLGHCHPAVTEAICRQAQTLMHVSNLFLNENMPRLAEIIVKKTFGKGRCFFCNSGAEANEGLIKLARKWGNATGRNEIVVMENSFHGRTLATLAATGRSKYREGFNPDMQGFKFAKFNDLKSVKKAIGPKTCAVLLEAVQGEGGILPADEDFIKGLEKLCREKDILLMFDEVQCGMGRTGTLCAWQGYGVHPDAFSFAKAIANGIPMGAFVCNERLSGVLTPGTHGNTFGGNALATAASLAVFETIYQDKILDNVREMGAYLRGKLEKLAEKYDFVKEVRGRGLMLGIVLDFPAKDILPALREKGLIALSAGEVVLRLLPPLIVRREDCDKAVRIIGAAFKEYSASKGDRK
jgi:predicted acetylornithine/succinylornithine family transaminase